MAGLTKVAREALESLHSVQDFVRWGASRFNEAGVHFGHGSSNAVDEALTLVLAALHLPHRPPPEFMQARLTSTEKREVVALLKRRLDERQPAAYLINEAWFAGLSFYVDERVLVPRSPIAELIEDGFEPWLDATEVNAVLDLCTGSGCIGIACAVAFPDAHVDAVDISDDALEVARMNVERYHLEDRVTLIKSDLLDDVPPQRYDLIVSNPPYVSTTEMDLLQTEYSFEPELGLVAGNDGLSCVRRILARARDYLSDNGVVVVEVGSSANHLIDAYPEVPFAWIEFERGGEGVFMLHARDLDEFAEYLSL